MPAQKSPAGEVYRSILPEQMSTVQTNTMEMSVQDLEHNQSRPTPLPSPFKGPSRKSLRIQAKSTPIDLDSLDSFQDSIRSEDLEVFVRKEDEDYERGVVIGKLSRIITFQSLWDDKLDSFFVFLSFMYTYDSSAALSVELLHHGESIIFAYLGAMIMFGIPMVAMEMWIGQYTSLSPAEVFARMAPVTAGIPLAQILANIAFLVTGMSNVLMMLTALRGVSLFSPPSWLLCSNWYNRQGCSQTVDPCKSGTEFSHVISGTVVKGDACYYSPAEAYLASKGGFTRPVTDTMSYTMTLFSQSSLGQLMFESMDDISQTQQTPLPTPTFYLNLAALLVVLIVLVWAPRNFNIQFIKVAVLLRIVSLLSDAIMFFSNSTVATKFGEGWQLGSTGRLKFAAVVVSMVVRSLKLGQGGLIFLSSRNRFRNGFLSDATILVMAVTLLTFFGSILHIIRFERLLYNRSHNDAEAYNRERQSLSGDRIYAEHPPVVYFVSYLSTLYDYKNSESLAVIVFTISIFFLYCMNFKVRLEMTATMLLELMHDVVSLFKSRTRIIIIQSFVICIALLFVTLLKFPGGYRKILNLEDKTLTLVCITLALCQVVTVCYIYGTRRFFADIVSMAPDYFELDRDLVLKVVSAANMFFLAILAPIMLLVSMYHIMIIEMAPVTIAQSAIASFILAPVTILCYYRIWQARLKMKPMMSLFTADRDLWGPRRSVDRETAEQVERKFTNFI